MQIPIVVVDWETYYDAEYSLSKITTEEYIRSEQFEAIGVSIALPEWGDFGPKWFPGETGIPILKSVDWSTHAFLAHHTAFDGSIAAWRYGIHARLYLDSMGMGQPHFGFTTGVSLGSLARVLDLGTKGDEVVRALGKRLKDFSPFELEEYGRYCCNDNTLCRKIFERLLPLTPPKELAAIDAALRCFIDPRIVLDQELLQVYHQEVLDTKQSLYIWCGLQLGIEPEEVATAIMSNDKMAKLLAELGVAAPVKLSGTTGKLTYAFAKTDDEFLELKEHEDPRVQALAAARLGGKSTLAETRAARLLSCATRGTLPIMLRYYAAHTGRPGGGDALNLTNLPRHQYKEGQLVKRSTLRDAMCAPPNHEFVSGDLSQIEARIIAFIAGQQDITEAFEKYDAGLGPDVYCVTASGLLGREITKADKNERQLGKVVRLSLPYGVGVEKLIATAKKDGVILAPPLAASIHARFRELSPYICHPKYGLWKQCTTALDMLLKGEEFAFGINECIVVKADGLHLPSGRVLRYPGLERTNRDWSVGGDGGKYGYDYTYLNRKKRVRIYGAKVAENITQSLAGSVCTDAWLRLRNKMPIVLQVYDELVGVVHESQVEVACEQMRAALTVPVKWLPGLPVACDVGHADRYGYVEKG